MRPARQPRYEANVPDMHDHFPGLPVPLPLGTTKRDAETQYLILRFLTEQPAGEQWANGSELFEAVRESYPRISFGQIYSNAEVLTVAKYLEKKLGEPEPERGGRQRNYYRATPSGKRAYANAVKTASRSPVNRPNKAPAPVVA